jgi:hypothetical protein
MRLSPIEGILAIVEEGRTSGTNKFGLLLALIDLAASVDKHVRLLPFEDISEKLMEIHWTHTREFSWDDQSKVLKQFSSSKRNTSIINSILEVQGQWGRFINFEQAKLKSDLVVWETAIKRITAASVKNPISLLQRLPASSETFLYDINASQKSIEFLPDTLEEIIRFTGVLRQVIENRFVLEVQRINKDAFHGNDLYTHLFDPARTMPSSSIRKQLVDLQDGRCIYSGAELENSGSRNSLDHVVPWSRMKISTLENFIVTTDSLNGSKSDSLPSPTNIERWLRHTSKKSKGFELIAKTYGWPSDIQRVRAGLSRLYEVSTLGTPVWDGSSVLGLNNEVRAHALRLLK